MVTALKISKLNIAFIFYPPLFSVEVKNIWSHASVSPCAFMVCGIVKGRNKLNFTHKVYKTENTQIF
jgi:hypothetical protein